MPYPRLLSRKNVSLFRVYALQTLLLAENIHSLCVITIIDCQFSPLTAQLRG